MIVALAGVAVAATEPSENVTLCAKDGSGTLSLAKKGKCAKGKRKLTIAKRGPEGPAGPAGSAGQPGPPGAAGKDGTPADLQPEAVRLVRALSAGEQCVNAPGAFCRQSCAASPSGCEWFNAGGGYVSAGYRKDAAGFVHLQGYVLTSGSPEQNKEIFYLPEGYRPTDAGRAFAARACQDNQAAYVDVLPNGAVTTGTACASLDGVSFHP